MIIEVKNEEMLGKNNNNLLYTQVITLQKEKQKLKEQLSNSHQIKNQQKEFIEWLERESKEVIRDAGYHQRICLEILSKYKKIIGVNGN